MKPVTSSPVMRRTMTLVKLSNGQAYGKTTYVVNVYGEVTSKPMGADEQP